MNDCQLSFFFLVLYIMVHRNRCHRRNVSTENRATQTDEILDISDEINEFDVYHYLI